MARQNSTRLFTAGNTAILCILLGLPGGLCAQVTGTISGYVTDPSGAAVAQAAVTATLVQQNVIRSVESNAEGFYNFPALLPGVYTLAVEKSGFERLIRSDVTLTVNQNVRVDMVLKVGAVTESVTVTGEASLVDTRSATVTGLVDDRRITDLPLNGRNIISLAGTLPGVLNIYAPQQMLDARGGPKMDVNGGRDNMNLFTFNGGYFNNPSRNTGINYPPPDAIQEFRMLTNNFSAEYGHNPGSQVNVVSKAGTNEFHGSVWEFLRNDALNARNWFSSRVPGEKQNQFGAAAGGPIRRDKWFLFGSYQGLRDHPETVAQRTTVPSAAHRSGDFSDLPPGTLFNPVDTLTGGTFTDSSGAPCVTNNIINPNCISPVAKNVLQFIPSSSTGTVTVLAPQPSRGDLAMARIDWNQSTKHSLFGHYYLDHNSLSFPFTGNLPYIPEQFGQETDMITLNDTYTFSPSLINQSVVSFLRTTSLEVNTKTITPAQLGINNMPQYPPNGSITFGIGNIYLHSGFTTRFVNNNWQFRDALNWMKGKHNFKFGGEELHLNFVQGFIGSPGVNFTGARAGDPLADFLLGAFASFDVPFGIHFNDIITNAPSLFFQDEFKVTPRFTLTYGVRWEPFFPWTDRFNRINTFKQGAQSVKVPDAPPGIVFPGDPGVTRGLAPADLNNFAPRLGFAWDVLGDGRTSVRGAYGVFYESINADSLPGGRPPWSGDTSVSFGRIEDPFGSVGLTPPPAAPGGKFGCVPISTFPGVSCPLFPLPLAGAFTDLSLRTPYVQSWNLNIQRQVTPNVMVETAYVGKIGTKIEALRTYNPARFIPGTVYDPVSRLENTNSTYDTNNILSRVLYEPGILAPYGFITGNDFRNWYHSFQAQVTRRFSRGLSVKASYTLAKSIDSSSTDNLGATVSDPFNLRTERGRSDWDRRHAFVVSWLWSPSMRFSRPWANTLLGGLAFSGITSLQSGGPLTFWSFSDVQDNGTFGCEHAFLNPNGGPIARAHKNRTDMVAQFFNINAFTFPFCSYNQTAALGNPQYIEQTDCTPSGVKYSLLGKSGNAGRGILSGPASADTDLAIIKDFVFKERYKVQFRAEFFNAFNQVNFGGPDTYIEDLGSTFGQITGAGSGRVIQFGLKVAW